MQIKKTVTVTLATLLLSGAIVGGATAASRAGKSVGNTPAVNTADRSGNGSTTDNDTLEQGDQTRPETPDATEARRTETSTESTSESESGSQSDGPGGHEDSPGNVDHQFEGEE